MPTDDAIADLRVLVASVGGDVKAVLAKLDDQNRRIEKTELDIKEIREREIQHLQEEISALWARAHKWMGASTFVVTLFSSGFIYLLFLLLRH